MESTDILKSAVMSLDNKKALDIEILEVKDLTTMADYFVICSGGSTTQIKALSDEVYEKLKDEEILPYGKEGFSTANWILMDYGSVIIHIFNKESRDFYSLEHLWSDAKKIDPDIFLENK